MSTGVTVVACGDLAGMQNDKLFVTAALRGLPKASGGPQHLPPRDQDSAA